MPGIRDVVHRERRAAHAHRASLRRGSVPPPSTSPRGTFLHGFLLPFSLAIAMFRDRDLRRAFLRVTAVRLVVLALLASAGCTGASKKEPRPKKAIILRHDGAPAASSASGMHVHLPGLHVDIDETRGAKSDIRVLGKSIPVVDVDGPPGTEPAEMEEPSPFESGWARVVAFVAALSGASAFIIALSRRYDDWLGFFLAQRLAFVKPEDDEPKKRKVAVDVRWLVKKLKQRVREGVAFASGIPILALLSALPAVGTWLLDLAMIVWGWYWLGVFTAAKNDHALVDAKTASPPRMIRALARAGELHWSTRPLRGYARLWSALTRSFHSPASFFERAPAAFLGLALARAILALPVLNFLSKPIVPVAAGRLCAEHDPLDRFALRPEPPTAPAVSTLAA